MRCATLTLPTVNNDGVDQTDTHSALQLTLVSTFGGFTLTMGQGAWESDTGKVHLDPIAIYSIAMAESGENETRLESIARLYGHLAGQICVMVTHARGNVVFVDSATVKESV